MLAAARGHRLHRETDSRSERKGTRALREDKLRRIFAGASTRKIGPRARSLGFSGLGGGLRGRGSDGNTDTATISLGETTGLFERDDTALTCKLELQLRRRDEGVRDRGKTALMTPRIQPATSKPAFLWASPSCKGSIGPVLELRDRITFLAWASANRVISTPDTPVVAVAGGSGLGWPNSDDRQSTGVFRGNRDRGLIDFFLPGFKRKLSS